MGAYITPASMPYPNAHLPELHTIEIVFFHQGEAHPKYGEAKIQRILTK
jgi:hypothetical protein